MDWLWLFLALIGLGLLWLMIVGVEKLTQRLREHDEMRRAVAEDVAKRTAQAEEYFLVNNYAKESARDYIENADFDENDDSILKSAIETLSSEELVKSVAKRMFGNPKGTNEITAFKSVFDQTPVRRRAVAKGEGVMPVKIKTAGKPELSKAEQKMLKKIKQGD